ncbi:CLUMA_CG013393, isoform A [Clunio marinus]|uniref:CLUMA_CG013393, isoform A n=1 Tax=Clunio marinus TaxID=568069 RepID=A0A1J1IIU2_9DIPT|nr:CLUMA_CG013393, isoform A [Clunio marinus]
MRKEHNGNISAYSGDFWGLGGSDFKMKYPEQKILSGIALFGESQKYIINFLRNAFHSAFQRKTKSYFFGICSESEKVSLRLTKNINKKDIIDSKKKGIQVVVCRCRNIPNER